MKQTKPWWQSKTIWGIIIAFGSAIALHFGVQIPAPAPNADYTALANYAAQVKAANGSIPVLMGVIVSAAASAYGIYGRVVAETNISTPPKI